MSETVIHNDSKEFKQWQEDHSITRIEGTNIYQWNNFKYQREFFLEKFQEHLNKQLKK